MRYPVLSKLLLILFITCFLLPVEAAENNLYSAEEAAYYRLKAIDILKSALALGDIERVRKQLINKETYSKFDGYLILRHLLKNVTQEDFNLALSNQAAYNSFLYRFSLSTTNDSMAEISYLYGSNPGLLSGFSPSNNPCANNCQGQLNYQLSTILNNENPLPAQQQTTTNTTTTHIDDTRQRRERRAGPGACPNDVGVLSCILNQAAATFGEGFSNVKDDTERLLSLLSLLEIAIVAVWWAFGKSDVIMEFLKKTIFIGFFIFLVLNFNTLLGAIQNSFVQLGLKAGGGSLSISDFTDPSKIAGYGMTASAPIFDRLEDMSMWSAGILDIMLTGLAGLVIIFSFFIIAIQIFVTLLEFYILSVMAFVLIPFGVFKHTSFLAEKAFGLILSFGVKLMVIAFILSIFEPFLSDIANALPDEPDFGASWGLVLATMAMAFICWQTPALAAGLLNGAPSLTAGSAAGFGAASMLGAAGAAWLTSAGARAAGSAAATGVSASSKAAGIASGAYKAGSAPVPLPLGSGGKTVHKGLNKVAAGMGGIKDAASNALSGKTQKISQKLSQPFRDGKEMGAGLAKQDSAQLKANPDSVAKAMKNKHSSVNSVHAAMTAQHAIPHESGPSGSLSANIKDRN